MCVNYYLNGTNLMVEDGGVGGTGEKELSKVGEYLAGLPPTKGAQVWEVYDGSGRGIDRR